MKPILLFLSFLMAVSFQITGQERPFIWVQNEDREEILEKIDEQEWANQIYQKFIDDVNADLKIYQEDSGRFLRKMPFDWDKQQSGKIPPFLLTFHVENGQQKNLDNATDREMEGARKLSSYLQTGIDCGIAYFLTHDENYAKCALDILYTFIEGVRHHEVSDWKGRGGWLFPYDGFREVRMLGYKVPLIFDFVEPYIKKGGRPFDFVQQKRVVFPRENAQNVFRTYADITVNYGQTGSNHPVLEAPNLVYNALAMDDPDEREMLLNYFLKKNTKNQDALNIMASVYKNKGDIWPETSQYLNHVSVLLTRLMFVLNKYDTSFRFSDKYPNILYSLPALDYMVYPNGNIIRWGDGKRTGKPPYRSYEEAYLLGKMDGNDSLANHFGSLLLKAKQDGKYKKRGIQSVLWYTDKYEGNVEPFVLPRTDRINHAGIFLQRNLGKTSKPEDGLMCFVGGAHMVHGHAEGMNMELYGEGEVLGVDNGRGSYQKDIHENYSRIFAAHNTVIVNGSSRGEGGWVNLGINKVQLKTMEPMPDEDAISPYYSFSTTSFVDDKGDKAEAYQERTLALIRTSETTGYYLDVFRSDSELPNEFHDYLYHNIGDELAFLNADMQLKATPDRYMGNANLVWKQNRQYRNPGWHFFEEVKSSDEYPQDVHVQFIADALSAPVFMDLYIPGFNEREYTKVNAPHTFQAPEPYNKKPTPTLVIRKKGEAWDEPFVVVYEPHKGEKSVQSVEKLQQDGIYRGVKVISKVKSKTIVQYILTQQKGQTYRNEELGLTFTGTFAIVTTDKENNALNLYLGSGKRLIFKDLEMSSEYDIGNGYSGSYRQSSVF